MPNIAVLKKDLKFNSELSSIIGALKAIAVTQFQMWQKKLITFEEFHLIIKEFFDFVDPDSLSHPFFIPNNKGYLVVGITSDSGLLGALNYQVVGTCLKEVKEKSGQLVIVGERGKMYLKGSDVSFVSFPGVKEQTRFAQAQKLKDLLIQTILAGKAGGLIIVYPRALSVTMQRIETMHLFPYKESSFSPAQRLTQKRAIKESSPNDFITYLGDLWIGQILYEVMGLSKLAEYSARVVHLEESTQKLKEINKKIKLKYFRARHEIIDTIMRELFTSRNIFKK